MPLSFADKIKPVTPIAPVSNPVAGLSFADKIKPVTPIAPVTPPEEGGFWHDAGNMAKSLISAPATIVARPFQAAAELLGAKSEDVNKFNLGGIIAPVPENAGDVKKDVGRAVQTVALGTGAPIAGGAAFGAGSSLEQGNDLFSTQTLFNTVLGAGAGKVLDLVGKPLLNAAGKAVGVITPQTLKDVAAGGADAITKFAAQHELLGGVAKPLSEKIATGAEAIDAKANRLFKGAGNAIKDTAVSQYPAISKENLQNRFSRIDQENIAKPTTKLSGYKGATEIFNNAKNQGTDLSKVAVENGITHDSLIEGKQYNTTDTADAVRSDAMKTSHDLMRPALAAAEPGVQLVPVSEVRAGMLRQVDKIPASQLTDTERAIMKERISNEYGPNSPAARAHPNGYSLTDLHDAKIATSGNAKFKPNGTPSENFPARVSKAQSDVFRKILEEKAPPGLDIKKFNKMVQQKFQLADYLDALHGKKVPQGVVRKSVELFGKVLGAGAGAEFGGGLGGVAGYHLGGVLFNSFDNLSNPLKAYYLNSIERAQPEIFKAFQDYLGKQEVERLLRPQLKAGNKMNANYPAINLGPHYSGKPNVFNNDLEENSKRLFNTKQLPTPKPRMITPNTQGTPNPTSGTYNAGGDKGRVGGQGQRIGAYYKKNT